MGMTLSEKILAVHCERDSVRAGEFVNAKVDLALGNDLTAPLCIAEFEKMGAERVWDPEKVVLVPDHWTPNKDIRAAQQAKEMREFARRYGIKHYFEVGRMGIEHALLPEKGLVLPGELTVGADSHTCTYGALGAFATGIGSTDLAAVLAGGECWFRVPETMKIVYKGNLQDWVTGKDLILFTIGQIGVAGAVYKAIEFMGQAIANLSMSERFSLCNMAVEAGAKVGLIGVDEVTLEYVRSRANRDFQVYQSDPDCVYVEEIEFDVSGLEPQVALPPSPENVVPISEVPDIRIHQAVIGSCTNGRLEDLRLVAKVLQGRKVCSEVRCLIIPATQEIYLQALREGLLEIFLEAGAAVSTPTCGPCLGGHMGVLAAEERAISTTNRNFVGRMGHPKSEVYLANPAVAAASAVTGRIVHPAALN